MADAPEKSLGHSVVRGAVWMVAMRWVMRGIGFINIALLARLLTPYDFGLVGLAIPLLAILMGIMDIGARVALVRHPHVADKHYNTFWTIGIIQAGLCCLGMLIAAPFAADFYGEPAVFELFAVLGISTLVRSFENGYIVALQKEMRFGRDFGYNTAVTLIRVGFTIGLAFYLKDYRALLYGHLIGSAAQALISYIVCGERRCRVSLEAFGDLWGVSKWLFIQNIGVLLSTHLDRLALGKLASVEKLGSYTVAVQVAAMPYEMLLAPLERVLQPAYSRKLEAGEGLKSAFLFTLGGISHVSVACYVGLALVAEPFVQIVFGAEWLHTVPFVAWFALVFAITAIVSPIRVYWNGLGYVKAPALLAVIGGLIFVAGIIPSFETAGVMGIIFWRLIIDVMLMLVRIFLLWRYQGVQPLEFILIIARPILSVLLMALVVQWVQTISRTLDPIAALSIEAIIGAISYFLAATLVWNLLGRPDGAERWALTMGKAFKQRHFPR